MSVMRNLWSDPTFLTLIQNKRAAGPAPAGAGPTSAGPDPATAANIFRPRTRDELERIPHKEPPKEDKEIPRAEVEKALTKFLEDMAKGQGNKNGVVKSTDKVWQAEIVLHKDLPNPIAEPYTKPGGDGHAYPAAILASKLAATLPDTIPIANYNKFLAMTPTETKLPGSTTEQIRRKYEEARDSIAAKITKKFGEKIGKLAKAGMDAAVKKGVGFVADKALEQAGVNSDEMKQAVDDYVKQVVDGEKDGGGGE